MQSPKHTNRRSIAVVGGGITGIAAALDLSKNPDYEVTLFEKRKHLGGLSDFYKWEDLIWDRYYHVILATDVELVHFVKDLGLEKDLFWTNTNAGFYGDGTLAPMSSTLDFIRFPFLSPWQKFRMGIGVLYSSRIKQATRLDRMYARTWLTRVFGPSVYEKIWDPLLRSKLGSACEKTSAAFIWATISRLYGTRRGKGKKEKMGHVKGGYYRILSSAERLLQSRGVNVHLGEQVTALSSPAQAEGRGIRLATDQATYDFKQLLFTNDCPSIMKIVKPVQDHSYWRTLSNIKYLSIQCVMLILKRRLSPYYVINLLDRELPFTGIIEVTNIVPPEQLGNHHIVYLPRYLPQEDPDNSMGNAAIENLFVGGLKKVFPDLRHEDILHSAVFREQFDQPLQELNYLSNRCDFVTPIPGVFVANTSMILNSTLNNNAAIQVANRVADMIRQADR